LGVAHGPGDERRGRLRRLLGRPPLLIFWSLVLWGTLYGLILIEAASREGMGTVLQRVLAGPDAPAGLANLTLAGVAALVWLGVAVGLGRIRSRDRRQRHTNGSV
jgi:hypothetical protein